MGFSSVNWNLGCPAPLVAKKARGCGLLPHKDIIKRFLDGVIPKLPLPLSIKARLGYESPNELEALIPLFNDYPIKELIIHPRTGIQLYGGTVDLDRFETCLNISKHTVVYNGDIVSVDTFIRLSKRFPSVNRWMTGRGIVRNPFLLTELRRYVDGTASSASTNSFVSTESTNPSVPTVSKEPYVSTASAKYQTSQIIGFLDDLTYACKDHPCPLKVLGRMKEIWRYLGSGIDGWEELSDKVIKCASPQEYKALMRSLSGVETQ
jgi:tRNA-dihydrouridine synthase